MARGGKIALFAASAAALMLGATHAAAQNYNPGLDTYDGGMDMGPAEAFTPGPAGGPAPVNPPSPYASVGLSFEGISQYNVAAFGRNFIPPDTMGAIGTTQFMETSNGAYAVYDKSTGAQLSLISDVAFWAAAGQTGANGDSRVLFDPTSQRWIVSSFSASLSTIQIAVSTTSNALGPWQSTTFTGYAGGIADYPTLAIDGAAVYIGTNDFDSGGNFQGTTLNVINRNDLFSAGAPTTTSLKQFFTACNISVCNTDNGFAIQGVNQLLGSTDSGQIIAASNFSSSGDIVRYSITNPGTAGATQTPATYLGLNRSDPALNGTNPLARQPYTSDPAAVSAGVTRTIDALDVRLSSAEWEQHGDIYSVQTVTPPGTDHTSVVWTVIRASDNTVLQSGTIGDGVYDYYQGSIAVNSTGQVVIGYDRSGDASTGAAGKISFFVDTFNPITPGGGPIAPTANFLIHVSNTDSYHNGSLDGQVAAGRQRWGDYSQVTVDPNNPEDFWAIGQFAREFNDAAGGHPGGTGGSRWGTWITEITLTAVPEPATWAMMLIGFGLLGGALRSAASADRRRALQAV
jgi:hypothetical protein